MIHKMIFFDILDRKRLFAKSKDSGPLFERPNDVHFQSSHILFDRNFLQLIFVPIQLRANSLCNFYDISIIFPPHITDGTTNM